MPDTATTEAILAALPFGEVAPASRPADYAERRAEALSAIAVPDLETIFRTTPSGLSAEFRGHDGYARGWDDWASSFESLEVEMDELIDLGDVLLIYTRQSARLAGNAVPMGSESAGVVRLQDGRVTRFEFHLERESARHSVGLEG